MFPIRMTVLDYRFFVNQLKMGAARKSCFFNCAMNARTLVLLKLLYRLGAVRRYLRLTSKSYRVFPNWLNGRSTLKSIRFFSRKHPIKLSLKALSILQVYTFNSYIILETSKGLITHQEALRSKLGGNLICFLH